MDGTSESRNRRWAATHRRIFTIALELFEDFGYEQVGVNQIAKRADVSVPTFYAHYPSKEHLIMAPPDPGQVTALFEQQSLGLSMGERVLRANLLWIEQMTPQEHADLLTRWRVIAATPDLRTRAAEYERRTVGMVLRDLPTPPDTARIVHASAALAATTAALLAWADGDGARGLDELFDEAFRALAA